MTLKKTLQELPEDVLKEAQACGLTVGTAESCTAGRLAALLSDAPGAAECFHGGFVTYTKAMKTAALAVPEELLRSKGAVCDEVARTMAAGVLERTPADLAVSVTGVAGPKPDEDGNPVGLVYCGIARRAHKARAFRFFWDGAGKDEILERALCQALMLLRENCVRT